MARLIQLEDFVGRGEKSTARVLERELPKDWVVICNKQVVQRGTPSQEVDFIVIGRQAIFVIDEKNWRGAITGNDLQWVMEWGESRRSPISRVEVAARKVTGILRDDVPRLDAAITGFFVHARVVLSSEGASFQLTDPRAKAQVLRLVDTAEQLIADDGEQPPNASIQNFREAVEQKLAGLPNRPRVPKRLGDYEILEERPASGPGRIFLGRHDSGFERLLRLVEKPVSAITETRDYESRVVLREYSALVAVAESGRGPRVDPYFTWGDSSWVIPVEPMAGQTLAAVSAGDPSAVKSVIEDAFQALVDIGSKGVIHRAISPDCIWVSSHGGAVALTDFSFAHVSGTTTIASAEQSEVGDSFRAPELGVGYEFAVPESDVYSLGASLVACLTRREPDIDSPWTPDSAPRDDVIRILGPHRAALLLSCLAADERRRPSAESVVRGWSESTDSPNQEPPAATAEIALKAEIATLPDRGPRVVAGRYAFVGGTGRAGGMADVYEATDLQQPGSRVALKVLRPTAHEPRLIKLFFDREIRSLRTLVHPNIVRLLDAGQDQSTGEHYLVLEWVPRDLKHLLATSGVIEGWDDFADRVGLPILSALAYAHEHDVVHRDVKPANVLVDDTDIPKLSDFGISHIKTTLATDGGTLADFASRPYAPPERDAGARFDRDVWGFAVLALASLSTSAIEDYPDVYRALEDLDAHPEIVEILRQCLDQEPDKRPPNALALLSRLEEVQRRREAAWTPREVVFLNPSFVLARGLKENLHLTSDTAVREFLERELGDAVYIRADVKRPGRLLLYGRTWSFLAERDPGGPKLTLLGGNLEDARWVDRNRDRWMLAHVDFRFRVPTARARAERVRDALFDAVSEHERTRVAAEIASEEQRLFREWRNQLTAWETLEKERLDPLQFTDGHVVGRRFNCRLVEAPSTDLEGQLRVVQFGDGRAYLRGEIETVQRQDVTIFLDGAGGQALGRTGLLLLDSRATLSSLKRQRDALRALEQRGPSLVRQDLPDLLLEPAGIARPQESHVTDWVQDDLDEAKRSAVTRALGSPDFFLVQGPPGTGKTSFIAELVAQTLRNNPKARVLLTSQTNVALDNALERIRATLPSARLVRLATAETQVAAEVDDLRLERRLAAWREKVRKGSDAFLTAWARDAGIPLELARSVSGLSELAEIRRGQREIDLELNDIARKVEEIPPADTPSILSRDDQAELLEERADLAERLARLSRQAEEVLGRVDGSGQSVSDLDPDALDQLVEERLGRGGSAAHQFVRLVGIQARWRERISGGVGFEEAVLYDSDVVAATCVGLAGRSIARELEFDLCILDEASKATATEALVPFIRARRWVLVGDEEQLPPYQEDALGDPETLDRLDLDPEELGRTIFSRLLEHASPECQILLDVQHRMVPAIGDLISTCFYGGRLKNARNAEVAIPELALPKQVTWFDTRHLPSRTERRAGRGGLSYVNPTEAELAARTLAHVAFVLAKSAGWKDRKTSCLVLAGYRPQVAEIERRVLARAADLRNLDIEVKTVDAVQGREADIVIYSVTRSNDRGDLGFLTSRPRANVALSRARDGLVIIGDTSLIETKPSPLRETMDYIRAHPDSCAIRNAEL